MNPLLFNQPSNINNLKSIYKAISQSNNPQQLFTQLAGQNPQLQPIVKALQQGISPQQIFDNICQQRGINPQEFINTLINNNT